MTLTHFLSFTRRLVMAVAFATPLVATAAPQQTFETPEAAVEAWVTALKANSDSAMIAIFGEEHRGLVESPDRAATTATRARTLEAIQTFRLLLAPSESRRVLVIGEEAWPVPIPLVRTGDRWRFASEEGAVEVANRRIGGNERNAIHVARAYVEAQRAYASRDRDADGVLQYARRIASTPGKRDGLYWPADDGDASPFGPLVAEGSPYLEGHKAGDSYRGYYFRVLTRQGQHAAGGAYSYLINGRMLGGFGLVAYPAQYGESGVMTFIVNQNGKVYERDLGKDSTKLGAGMTAFDPGPGWREVQP